MYLTIPQLPDSAMYSYIKNGTCQGKIYKLALSWMILPFLIILLPYNPAKAQLVYSESFESPASVNTITMPLGWHQYRQTLGPYPDDYWNRVTAGVNPACSPMTGNMMMRFRSRSIISGQSAVLATKRFDMRAGIPPGGAGFNFWMYRDNAGFTSSDDRIEVYVDTTPDMSGTPIILTEIASSAMTIHRSCALSPAPATCNGWNSYNYIIPNVPVFNGSSSVYVLIVAISGNGNDIHLDDFSITSFPNAQDYTTSSAEVLIQNTLLTQMNSANQVIIGCRLTMDGAASPKVLTQMEFNTNGSSNPPTDINNAKLWYSGGTGYFNTDNAILLGVYSNPWATNYMFLTAPNANYSGMASYNGLEHGYNYFWLTYDIPAGAIVGNYVDAEWIDFHLSSLAPAVTLPNPMTLAGARMIEPTYCYGYYTVGTAWNDYNNNDFINRVTLIGNNTPVPGINNNFNSITRACGTNAASGCSNGPFPKDCPFQNHPFDYELFTEISGKTTSLTADNTTNYPISIQCGTYTLDNSVAAWIDYNQDKVFNNWFYEVTISCTGNAGSDTIFLSTLGAHPGWRAGMSVSGTGIAPGATIVTAGVDPSSGAYVVLSAPNVATVSGGIFFSDPDGEKIVQSQGMGPMGTYNTTFRVPTLASQGKTRLRVRENWVNFNISPCVWYTYGEIEDYTITIAPSCQPYPNYTTWLGFTDHWEDPANWCPAVAPLSTNPLMNVRIPGGPSGAYTYNRPMIRPGMNALTAKLRIETDDTLYIQAGQGSSLTIEDSLMIKTNTSSLVVNPGIVDTVQVSNGTINMANDSPLNHYSRSRSFLTFTQAELLANGLQVGDVVTNLRIHIQRKSNGNPYKNCTVKYYYASAASSIFNAGYFPNLPAPSGVPAAPVTIFSGDLYPSAYIPTVNGYGTIDLALQTPFAWSGTSNPLVIEICYDNTGFPTTGTNEEPRGTQTTNLRRYLTIRAVTDFGKPGCDLNPTDTIMVNASWSAGSNTITIDPAQAANVLPGMISYLDGSTVISVVGTTVTMSSNATTSGTNVNIALSNVLVVSSTNRPNVTFVIQDDNIKYPINVRGHWENNGTFVAGLSRVTFDGTVADQQIGGQSVTTFYDIDIDNPNHVMRLTDFVVTDSLHLINGRLKLNVGMVTLLNPSPSALTRINGYIQSETDLISGNVFPFGRLYWKMDTITGTRVIPFVNTFGAQVFMSYNAISGTHDVVLGTYGTNPDNTNYPLPEVTNVIGWTGTSYNASGDGVVDRFYLIKDSLGVNPNASVIFRYANGERALANGTGLNVMQAQRWLNADDIWEYPFIPGQQYNVGTPDWVIVPMSDSVFSTSSWWTVAQLSTPLGYDQYTDLTPCWNELRAGYAFTAGIKQDNSLWTWGENASGQLGDGTNTNKNYPVMIGPPGVWLSVAVGKEHTLAIRADGTLWAWGNNDFGQLGDGSTTSQNQPVQIGTGGDWKAVSAGEDFSIALKSDNTMWAWGNNLYGQLGTGNNNAVLQPTQVGSLTTWHAISCGQYHVLATLINGTLWAWGKNTDGALGTGNNTDSNIPLQVGTLNEWKQISAGEGHSLAMKTTGTIWSWGKNSDGQLGNGTFSNTNVPGQIGSDTTWVRITNGWSHNHAVKADGSLWSWGDNQSGQLGDNSVIDRDLPIQIAVSMSWMTAQAGYNHSLGIGTDGTLWSWGDNTSGQFGNETNIGSVVPIQNIYFSDFIPQDTIITCDASVVVDAGPGYNTYLWSNGSASQSILVSASGWYICTVLTTSCFSTDSIFITVNGSDTTFQNASICPGYTFTLPNGQVVSTPGVYQVNFININGCDSVIMVNLSLYTTNFPPAVTGTLSICQGIPATLNATPGFAAYLWNTGEITATINPASPGVYTVTVTDNNGCIGVSAPVNVVANPLPAVNASASQTTFCINHPPAALSGIPAGGTWLGPGLNGTTFDPALAGAGIHQVIYSFTDPTTGCTGADTISMTVNLCTGIVEVGNEDIVLFPNPASNQFMIVFSATGLREPVSIEIYDQDGKLVEKRTTHGRDQVLFDTDSWRAGNYQVVVNFKGGAFLEKTMNVVR